MPSCVGVNPIVTDAVTIDVATKDAPLSLSPTPLTTQARPEIEVQWNFSLSTAVGDTQKKILDRAVGVARPGEVLAIMGPSGAGKTSLLNCISGRNKKHDGSVTLQFGNGERRPWSKAMKRITAYVQQDDLILSTITPREHLLFQASLQMDQSLSQEEIEAHVDSLLEQLNLTKCKDTPVGDPTFVRGISGGERKRVSFAAQLLGDPSVLFVDEPTSGLDSHMAEEVVSILRELATQGDRRRTIITTIHQPTSHAYAAFDQLLLLSDGRGVYLGPAAEAVNHFAGFGPELTCPQYVNPSDFFLHVLGVSKFRPSRDALCEAYNIKWKSLSKEETPAPAIEPQITELDSQLYSSSCWRQFSQLLNRTWVCRVRNPRETHVMFLMTIFFSVIMGLVYFQLDNSQKAVQSRNGIVFMAALQMAFQQISPTIQVFAADLPMYMREHKQGAYSMTALYLARMVGDFPFQLIVPIIYSVPLYWMVGLPPITQVFLKFVLVVVLTANAAASLGYLLGCGAPNATVAQMLMPVVLMPNMLLSGFMINLDNIPIFIQPFSYASFVRYAMGASFANVWTASEYDNMECSAEELAGNQCKFRSGQDVLNYLSIDKDGFVFNCIMLVALSVGFRVMAYIALRLRARKFKTANN